MTEFQLGLLIAGALLVAGVVIYNKVQERAAGARAERQFRSGHGDVLLETVEARREPTLGANPQPAAQREPPAAATTGGPLPDPQLDYVLELAMAEPVAAQTLLRSWQPFEHRFAKRALLAGERDDGDWSPLTEQAGQAHRHVRAGYQLVTRRGAATEAELIEFRSAVETLAAGLGATLSSSELPEVMERARELDRLCADADVQVVIHVAASPGEIFRGTKIRAAAESSGLALGEDGRFALRDAEDRVLYTLGTRDGTPFSPQTIKTAELPAVSLAMDVPRAPETRRTYEAMARFARQLASSLGGSLVDDNGRVLDDRALAAIADELEVIPKALGARGFAPGSAAALRLFS